MSAQSALGPRPDPLPLPERLISYGIRAPLFFVATAFFATLALLVSAFEKSGRWQHRIAQAWARFSVFASGAKVTILNAERLRARPAVYVCNHLSYMDTPVIFSSLPFQFRIVARHDLFDLPFIGWYLRRSGQVPVDVANPRASIASLVGAVRTLKSGMPLFIFPEGGRTETGDLSKFLNGPAFMAIRAQLPLIPMALIGTHELLPIHASELHPVPVTLVVGKPIETVGRTMKQVDELTSQLEEQIARMYYEHSWRNRPEAEPPARSESGTGEPESATMKQDLPTEITEEAPK
jgi:1-acyl-sn-glycerol-3-phosphate acyltransferase